MTLVVCLVALGAAALTLLSGFGLGTLLLPAFAGARLLVSLSDLAPLAAYELAGRRFVVTPIKLAMGLVIASFSWLELSPALADLRLDPRWLPAGGALSGFFGGLSGHQGALRAAFLAKSGLDAKAFVATGVACAVLVDCARLSVYGLSFWKGHLEALALPEQRRLVALAAACAFAGSFLGARVLGKVTMKGLQRFVGVLLLIFGAAMMAGLL